MKTSVRWPRLLVSLFAAACGLLLAAAFLAAPRWSAGAPELDAEESSLLSMINEYRAQNGNNPLAAHPQLNAAADWYATDMATNNYFGNYAYCYANFQIPSGHCDSLGRLPGARVAAFGYPAGVGENSAGGFTSAQSVFNAWRNSPGHNSNMLGGSYTVIGIGRACNPAAMYNCYWVTDFGAVNAPPSTGATPSVTATAVPTGTPTPAASPAPSSSPAPLGLQWGDLNCDGEMDAMDLVTLLGVYAGLAFDFSAACPALDAFVAVGGGIWMRGDFDCSGLVATLDGMRLLEFLSGLGFDPAEPGCPLPGIIF